jgi:hypothetical protein
MPNVIVKSFSDVNILCFINRFLPSVEMTERASK